MPKIYEYFGLIFLFYSDDHLPVHVHAKYGNHENKLEFVYENNKLVDIKVKKTKKVPLPPTQLAIAKRLAIKKEKQITEKWTDFFARKKKPLFERITKRIV